jgi:hypothetical protein
VIRAREQLVQKLLGEWYNVVYDLCREVLIDLSDYKILRARRCQVLFDLFVPIILLREGDLEVRGTFLSSNALENYIDRLQDSKVSVLIVDDVLIHGRGIKRLYEQIDPDYSRYNVKIVVFYYARSANYIGGLLRKRFHRSCYPTFDYEWRDISCRFVDLITASAVPYESFAGYLDCLNGSDRLQNDARFEVIQTISSESSSGFVLFEKEGAVPAFFDEIGYDSCLRVYTNSELNVTTYVPYIFLKNISTAGASNLFQFVNGYLDDKRFANIKDTLSKTDPQLCPYQMRLFSALVNRLYGAYLSKRYGILGQAKLNRVNMELCFGYEITEELDHVCYDDVSALLNERPPYDARIAFVSTHLSDLFAIPSNDDKDSEYDMYSSLSMYYFRNGQYDEQRAREKKERDGGLSVDYFYEQASRKKSESKSASGLSRHHVSAAQLHCWDLGQASGIMRLAMDEENRSIVGLYGVAGEQNFRFVLQQNEDFFAKLSALYSISAMGLEDDDKIHEEYLQLVEDATDVKKFPKNPFKQESARLLGQFIKEHEHELSQWLIPRAIV